MKWKTKAVFQHFRAKSSFYLVVLNKIIICTSFYFENLINLNYVFITSGLRQETKGYGRIVTTKQWFQVEVQLDVFIHCCSLSRSTSTWNHCFMVTEANSGKVYSCLLIWIQQWKQTGSKIVPEVSTHVFLNPACEFDSASLSFPGADQKERRLLERECI
jgi:hypothetical protein